MKKKLFLKFFVLAVIGAFVTFTSCKDYDDDISKLEKDIAGLSSTLNELKAKVDGGAVITNVTPTNDGVTVTLSDGKTFTLTNGKDGIDGDNGKDGSVVTIGENGNWFIDGKDTELAAQGPKGDKGDAGEAGKDGNDGNDGKDGNDGVDGKDGVYYVPNADGYWYKHDGDAVTKTDDKWLLPGVITAVMNEYGDVTFHNVKSGDETFAVTFYNNKLLRSLVLIPHYYVNGVEAIGFSPINYLCEDEPATINPKVLVKYHVNPSSITEDMIDTENLSFAYKLQEERWKSAAINPQAKFVSLNDGILTVEVIIDSDEVEDYYNPTAFWSTMDMIALQVPLSEKAKKGFDFDAIVTSDYGRVDLNELCNVGIDRMGYLAPKDFISYSGSYNTVALAKAEDTPYMVEVAYDGQVDLIDYVTSFAGLCEEGSDAIFELDLEQYGLEYRFDLIDTATDKPIEWIEANNETDQQDFINLVNSDKGTVKSKVYTEPGTGTAAIGRTPLVRVQLIDTQNDCVVSYGYIKIKFVKDVPAIEKDITLEGNFDCDGTSVFIKEAWMNVNVYNAIGLSSAEFHTLYKLDTDKVYDVDGEELMGTVIDHSDDYPSGQVTEVVEWKISACDIFASTTKSLNGYVYYRSKADNTVAVKINVTAKVNMPNLSLYGHNTTYWKDNLSTFTLNPITYGSPVQVNPTANYRANLLNGFRDVDGNVAAIPAELIKSSIKGFTPCDAEFVFDYDKLKSKKYFVGTEEYSVAKENLSISTDGRTLYFGNIKVATITVETTGWYIALDENGQEANSVDDSWPTEEAQALIGNDVPVKLVSTLCCNLECDEEVDVDENEVVVKSFNVAFIKPIKINASLNGQFIDAVVGGSKVSVASALTYTDWNNYAVRATAFTNPTPLQASAVQLYGYYEIQDAVWNLDEATTNLKDIDGDLTPTEGYTSGIIPQRPNNAGPVYEINWDSSTKELTFFNHGNTLDPTTPPLTFYIPVEVEHKWGTEHAVVSITAVPAAGNTP